MKEFKKNLRWAALFLAVIAVCLLVILLNNLLPKNAKTAKIIQDGCVLQTIDLRYVAKPYEFNVISPDGGMNTVRVENGRIAITEADCPDRICVRQGFIDDGVLPIVCLPHKLSIVVTDSGADIDAVTGGM